MQVNRRNMRAVGKGVVMSLALTITLGAIGCGGTSDSTKALPKMPKDVYEQIAEQSSFAPKRTTGKIKTLNDLIKAKGFTMDDYMQAMNYFGMPEKLKKGIPIPQNVPR
jgi:hypothetical protein